MYAPLIREGGIIAFHDIVQGPSELVGGVPRLWNELKKSVKARTVEIVRNKDQGGWGIGVLSTILEDEQ